MIFQPDTISLVLTARKTQTRRKIEEDGVMGMRPCMYKPGRTYAVQPGRGKPSVGRIRVLTVDRVLVTGIPFADAIAEGFNTTAQFYDRWRQLHGNLDGFCWRIEFRPVT